MLITGLSHQGLLPIPILLSKKTMDEVWSKIHKDETSKVELEKENISNED